MVSIAGLQCNTTDAPPASTSWSGTPGKTITLADVMEYKIVYVQYPGYSYAVIRVHPKYNISIGDEVRVDIGGGLIGKVVNIEYKRSGGTVYKEVKIVDPLYEVRDVYIERCFHQLDADTILSKIITENTGYSYSSPGASGKTLTIVHRGKVNDILATLLETMGRILYVSYDAANSRYVFNTVPYSSTVDYILDAASGAYLSNRSQVGEGVYSRVRVLGGYVTETVSLTISCVFDATAGTFTCTRSDTNEVVAGPSAVAPTVFSMGEEIVGDVRVTDFTGTDPPCLGASCVAEVYAGGTEILVVYQSTPQDSFTMGVEYAKRRRVVAEAENADLVSAIGRRTYIYTDAGILDDVVAGQVAQDILASFKLPEYIRVHVPETRLPCPTPAQCLGKMVQYSDPFIGSVSGLVLRVEYSARMYTLYLVQGKPRALWKDVYELTRKLNVLESAGGFFQ